MAENTKIQWCHHTWNPWRGCTKVSPGCANCYAEAGSKRNPGVLGVWGPNGTRVVASESMWREPIKWNVAAAKTGERHRVFCASLADVFEDWQGPIVDSDGNTMLAHPRISGVNAAWPLTLDHVRTRLFQLIDKTPYLDWLLLTKRPENIAPTLERMRQMGLVSSNHFPWSNVWLGTSVENQECAHERIPHLLRTPAAVRFLSVEPLLGQVILHKYLAQCSCGHGHGFTACPNTGGVAQTCHYHLCGCKQIRPLLSWVIIGGESGYNARPCQVEWIRSIVQHCRDADVPVFVKQLGSRPRWMPKHGAAGLWPEHVRFDYEARGEESNHHIRLRDSKGGEPAEFPADLRVREFPEVKL